MARARLPRVLGRTGEVAWVSDAGGADAIEIAGLAWSPDSAWLAWSHPGTEPLRRLRMVRVADPGTVVDVTDGRFTDSDPAFTADGKYLAFSPTGRCWTGSPGRTTSLT